jgi:nitrogen regulatory protein PII
MNLEATLYDSKDFGKEKEKVRVGRGKSEAELSCSTGQTIVTIVDSDKLEEIINTIKKSAGSGGVGIIVISSMDALIHM